MYRKFNLSNCYINFIVNSQTICQNTSQTCQNKFSTKFPVNMRVPLSHTVDLVLKGGVHFKEDELTKKVTMEIKSGYSMILNKRMSRILGFGGVVERHKKTVESPYISDLSVLSAIYVYCDIVEPQVVGDTNAQLLRSIPLEGKFGDIISETFVNIQYSMVQRKLFEDIEILLRGDTGDPVPFERGKVVVTLHPRKYTYFT